MSKKLQITMLIVLTLCMVMSVLILSACKQSEHTHTYGDWQVTDATCETAGLKKRACKDCGYEQTQSTDALGHDWEKKTVQSETCQHGGE